MGIRNISNRDIKTLSLKSIKPSNVVGLRKNIRALWDAFTVHLYDEVSLKGKCSIVATKSRTKHKLFLEDIKGERSGPIPDPLKIAKNMFKKGLERIEFTETEDVLCMGSSMEKVLLSILSDGFRPILKGSVFILEDFSVNEIAEQGLPILSDTSYSLLQKQTKKPKLKPKPLSPRNFHAELQKNLSAEKILEIFHKQIYPHYQDEKSYLLDFIKILMAKTKWFCEVKKDIDSAIKLWTAVYNLNFSEDQNLGVVLTMMDVANKLTDLSLPRENRDIDSAIKLWNAVYNLNISEDQKLIAVKTMMDVANKLTDLSLPRENRDIDSAIKLWNAVYNLNFSEALIQRIISTIMDIASESESFCKGSIVFFEKEKSFFSDPYFYVRVLMGLHYHSGNFKQVFSYIDSLEKAEPSLIVIKADALRKLKKYEHSISVCLQVTTKHIREKSLTLKEKEGLVQAFCCMGYCNLEMSRGLKDPKRSLLLSRALTDFKKAVEIAKKFDYPCPPRAYTGLGYAYKLMGRDPEAKESFEKALEIDADNIKALRGLT